MFYCANDDVLPFNDAVMITTTAKGKKDTKKKKNNNNNEKDVVAFFFLFPSSSINFLEALCTHLKVNTSLLYRKRQLFSS